MTIAILIVCLLNGLAVFFVGWGVLLALRLMENEQKDECHDAELYRVELSRVLYDSKLAHSQDWRSRVGHMISEEGRSERHESRLRKT